MFQQKLRRNVRETVALKEEAALAEAVAALAAIRDGSGGELKKERVIQERGEKGEEKRGLSLLKSRRGWH